MKHIIHTSKAPAAIGPYSQGNRAGDTVYLSGQLGIDPATGKLAEGGVGAQARQSLKNIQALLAEVGATVMFVVCGTVFLTSLAVCMVVRVALGGGLDSSDNLNI